MFEKNCLSYSRNLINSEGFSRISSELAIYEEVENWKCFENCAPQPPPPPQNDNHKGKLYHVDSTYIYGKIVSLIYIYGKIVSLIYIWKNCITYIYIYMEKLYHLYIYGEIVSCR